MAAGKFTVYTSGIRYVMQGFIDLDTSTIKAAAIHNGYTPGTSSHSVWAQVSNFVASSGTNPLALISCGLLNVTQSGNVAIKYDMQDISGFSAGGTSFMMKYCVLFASASSGGIDNPLLCFFDTDTGSTTGVEGVQVNITIPAGGLFKINTNV